MLEKPVDAWIEMKGDGVTVMTTRTAVEPFVGTAEVSEFLGKPPSWVYDNAEKLGIPRHKLGKQYRYRLSEVGVWLEQQGVNA